MPGIWNSTQPGKAPGRVSEGCHLSGTQTSRHPSVGRKRYLYHSQATFTWRLVNSEDRPGLIGGVGWTDGQMDGWTRGWADGWMGRWIDGRMEGRRDGGIEGGMDGGMEGHMDELMDGGRDGGTERGRDGWVSGGFNPGTWVKPLGTTTVQTWTGRARVSVSSTHGSQPLALSCTTVTTWAWGHTPVGSHLAQGQPNPERLWPHSGRSPNSLI